MLTNSNTDQITYIALFSVTLIVLIAILIMYNLFLWRSIHNKVYAQSKIRWNWYVIQWFFAFLVATSSIVITILYKDNALFWSIPIFWFETLLWILSGVLGPILEKRANQHKKQIANFREEDFQTMLVTLEKHKPHDQFIERYTKSHKFYLSQMVQQQKIIEAAIDKYQEQDYQQILTNIIFFNDRFSAYQSRKANYFQMKIFLDLCINFQQKIKIFEKNPKKNG